MAPSALPGHGKNALVVGASRGMGRQVAVDLALKGGYAVGVAAKTRSPPGAALDGVDPNSPESTVDTVAHDIVKAGGRAHAVTVDVRDENSVKAMVEEAVQKFGKLDVLVYNSGAIWWASVKDTPLKRFQLMQRVNPEGLYATVSCALPHLAEDARVVVVSPPIYSRFTRGKTAYAMGKFGMSALTLGLAQDWKREASPPRKAITSLWPAAAIDSAATRHNDPSGETRKDLRKATIFSDAVLAILAAPPERVNGLLTTDEDFLRDAAGVRDFAQYSLVPGTAPRRIMPAVFPSLRVAEEDDEGVRMNSVALRQAKL
ncbi:short chain dehydrogenase family protein [Auricularia subglabra TFB-10046 SS5]|uniref:Short chain dehydrogenase family protein n=1 Tax=Auricularia subglabra (strain TFB-10046 / SS5) TaxID=717982 RepID=J0WUY1_AURST|nr:short chain dehydrogenase family protein [Auricularia subglabra TFB-10046 SS5]